MYIFYFPVAGTNEEKKKRIMKKKKLCRIGWATAQVVLQYKKNCIVTKGPRLLDCVATEGRDTASQATTRRRQGTQAGTRGSQGARGTQALGVGQAQGWARGARSSRRGARGARSTADREVWVWPVRAGWAKLVHCAPGLVLTQFLTQF